MRTSNINSAQNITMLYDQTEVGDPFLGEPNDQTNQLWSKDYRAYIIICADGVSPLQYITITFLNNDNTTTQMKLSEGSIFTLYLPLHAKITNIIADSGGASDIRVMGIY